MDPRFVTTQKNRSNGVPRPRSMSGKFDSNGYDEEYYDDARFRGVNKSRQPQQQQHWGTGSAHGSYTEESKESDGGYYYQDTYSDYNGSYQYDGTPRGGSRCGSETESVGSYPVESKVPGSARSYGMESYPASARSHGMETARSHGIESARSHGSFGMESARSHSIESSRSYGRDNSGYGGDYYPRHNSARNDDQASYGYSDDAGSQYEPTPRTRSRYDAPGQAPLPRKHGYSNASEVPDIFSLTRHNRYDQVEHMLDSAVPVDITDRDGNTILIVACQNGLKRIAKLALRRGANINCQNFKGNTPLHYCYAYGYGETLGAYLISKGANPAIRNTHGEACHEVTA